MFLILIAAFYLAFAAHFGNAAAVAGGIRCRRRVLP